MTSLSWRRRVAGVLAGVAAFSMINVPSAEAIAFGGSSYNKPVANSVAWIHMGFWSGCTGTLVDRDWVLTADHCMAAVKNPRTLTISVGTSRHSGEKRKVAKVVRHGKYDAALIKLSAPVKARPAPLWDGGKVRAGTRTTSVGFGGLLGPKSRATTSTGSMVNGGIKHIRGYSRMVGENNRLSGFSKIVPGDSGGPLFVGDKLYGVVSGGRLSLGAIFGGTTTVHTPVHEVKGWIDSTTR